MWQFHELNTKRLFESVFVCVCVCVRVVYWIDGKFEPQQNKKQNQQLARKENERTHKDARETNTERDRERSMAIAAWIRSHFARFKQNVMFSVVWRNRKNNDEEKARLPIKQNLNNYNTPYTLALIVCSMRISYKNELLSPDWCHLHYILSVCLISSHTNSMQFDDYTVVFVSLVHSHRVRSVFFVCVSFFWARLISSINHTLQFQSRT